MAEKVICQKCGKELAASVRFCGMCGTPIPSAKPSGKGAPRKPAHTAPIATAKQAPPPPAQPAAPPAAPPVAAAAVPPARPPGAAPAATRVAQNSEPPQSPHSRSEFQRLLDEVESGFDSIVTGPPPPATEAVNVPHIPRVAAPPPSPTEDPGGSEPTGEIPMDMAVARSLYDAMVVEHARPIRDFMIEVRLGEPLRAWVDFAMPAVRAILRSSQGMGITDFVAKLEAYRGALDIAQGGTDRLIRGELRQAIIDTYSDLTAFMPDAFALEQEANRREAVIVHSLLQQVPGLQKVSTDRVYGAGLTSLALFYVARPTDISELTGIPVELAEAIVHRFKEYRKKTESLSPVGNRAAELGLLGQGADELDQIAREYDGAGHGAEADARRRELRRKRSELMVEIGLLLARLGEVERLRAIEKLPFAERARQIRAFMDEAKRREVPKEPMHDNMSSTAGGRGNGAAHEG